MAAPTSVDDDVPAATHEPDSALALCPRPTPLTSLPVRFDAASPAVHFTPTARQQRIFKDAKDFVSRRRIGSAGLPRPPTVRSSAPQLQRGNSLRRSLSQLAHN